MNPYAQPPFQPQRALSEFFEAFSCARISDLPGDHTQVRNLCEKLLREETEEAIDALRDGQLSEIAKELADTVYVAFYAAEAYGIDLERVFREVHGSNMSKVNPDGTVTRRSDGKVLKGASYRPPDLDRVLNPTLLARTSCNLYTVGQYRSHNDY